MNIINFSKLIHEIYFSKTPNLENIQKLGLLAVKIAQMYALRIDFLDETRCLKLANLYRKNKSLNFSNIESIIEKINPDFTTNNFNVFEETPLAIGSIGQVHQAELKTGQKVVVKIIKSDFEDTFKQDISKLKKLFEFFIFFYPKLKKLADPIAVLEDIETQTMLELDLRNELSGQKTLKTIYQKYEKNLKPFLAVELNFNQMYEEFSSKYILVSEFVEGKSIDELLLEEKMSYQNLLDFFFIQGTYMFGEGIYHGDIHPGNIYFKDNQVTYLDTGTINHTEPEIRSGLFKMFTGLCNYDFKYAAEALHEMSKVKLSENRYKEFLTKFLFLYQDFPGKSISEVSMSKQMMQTIRLAIDSGMDFTKGMYPIIKSFMYLDGMALRCNPKAELLKDIRPFLENFKKIINID